MGRRPIWSFLVAVSLAVSLTSVGLGQGIMAPSAGPINGAMAGASTAAPVDFGSSYWNPANLSGLERDEFLLGSQLIIPSFHLQTQLPAGTIGGVFPPNNRFGTARSDSGVIPGLAFGASFRLREDSPVTFGLGVFGLALGGVNYAGNNSVPLLTPLQPPKSFGFGPIFANMALLQIAPMTSLRVNDKLSVGAGPLISTGTATFAPALFAPYRNTGQVIPTFPSATNSRPFWGGGFQVGLLYELNENWNLGFSYKSPIWQERWGYNAATPDLVGRRIGIQAQLPATYSWGVAYKGIERMLVDVDLRYIDYANTSLFGQSVPDGGLGWRSVFAVATGVKYQLTDNLTLLGGYLYNTNPIPTTATLFNVQAPAITTNTLSIGSSLRLSENVVFTAGWMHGFRNAISGGVEQLPGATVRMDTQTDSILAGLNIQYGGPKKIARSPVAEASDPMLAPPPPAGSTGS